MQGKIRVTIETLGCKLNQAESDTLARQFTAAGCQVVPPGEMVDAYILNTCTVTHIADRKSRQLLRKAKRLNPAVFTVATGCYANRVESELWTLPDLDLILKNENKTSLVDIITQRLGVTRSAIRVDTNSRTRAFIKAQDGCKNRCAYCIVPFVRNKEISIPDTEIISEIKLRVADGCKEVVLTGTEVGSYSYNGLDIKLLLGNILSETEIGRLRISSLQPNEITPALLSLWHNSRLCPHFHVSLQSGADSVLARMQRGYSSSVYEAAILYIRSVLPDASITTDVIVGFPGETEDEFQHTLDFCRRMGFARIHIFPFSLRPGTAAANMPGQTDIHLKKERSTRMLALAEESSKAFRARSIHMTVEVLWEQKSVTGVWAGYTSNYLRVFTRNEKDLTNVLSTVKLLKLYKDGVWGIVA
jgi:threonylcarbamoyladenosine tRNA methylthiotransferase MtaB